MDVKNVSSNIAVSNYLKNVNDVDRIKKIQEVQETNKIDKIELSKFAKEMVSVSNMGDDTIKNEKIKEIRKSLENGTYKINPEEIAKKMLEDMRG